MSDFQEAKTTAIKNCHACGGGLLESDRFCRWCRARQTEPTERIESGAIELVSRTETFETSPLAQHAEKDIYRPVSGPLVRAISEGIAGKQSLRLSGRVARGVVAALVAFPIWMIIVLLSPLDAYFVARAVSSRA
jgi:hypothetical protein